MLLLRGDLPSRTGGHPATSEEYFMFSSFPGIDFPLRFNQEAYYSPLVLINFECFETEGGTDPALVILGPEQAFTTWTLVVDLALP